MRRAALVALAAAALLAGCGDASRGETYAIAPADLREALLDTDAPIGVLGSEAVDWKTSPSGDDAVLWMVLGTDDKELLRFTATVVPVGQGARVDVAVLPPESALKDRVAKGLAENGSVRDLYRLAMTEEIDAKLEHRGFDFSRIAGATMQAAAANMGSISDRMDKAGAEFRKRDEENIARAYREEGHRRDDGYGAVQQRPFGAPMMDPNKP